MTTPQDLADRLEKARDAIDTSKPIEVWARDRAHFRDLCLDNLPAILASLRRSAPASGEMREAAIDAAQKATDETAERIHVKGLVRRLAESIAVDGIKAYDAALRTPSGETREEAGS